MPDRPLPGRTGRWRIDKIGVPPITCWHETDEGEQRFSVLWPGWEMTAPDGDGWISTGTCGMLSATKPDAFVVDDLDEWLHAGGVTVGEYTLREMAEIAYYHSRRPKRWRRWLGIER